MTLGDVVGSGRGACRSIAGLAALTVLAALPCQAGASWSSPETVSLSSTSVSAANFQLTTNPGGDATLSWKEGTNVVRVALRPSAGPFGSSQTLDANTGSASPAPRAGLGPDGRSIVMWFSNNGGRKLRFADRVAGAGSFGSAQDVFTPSEDITSLDVVIDAGEATHVAYNGPGYNQYKRVWARTRGSSSSTFGAESSIPAGGNLTPGAPGNITLGTATNGSSVLTFYDPSADFAPGSQQQHIEGVVRAQDDASWTTTPGGGSNDWFCCLSLGPQGVSDLAMDASGNTYFVVNGVNDFGTPAKPGPNSVLVGSNGTVVQGRQQLDPTWSNAGSGGTNGGASQVAVDQAGNAWAAWAKEESGEMKLYTAFRPAGAGSSFGAGQAVANDLNPSFDRAFRLAATAAGAVLVWQGSCSAGACEVESLQSGAASGTFSSKELVTSGSSDGSGLQLAELPGDHALLSYRENGGDLKARVFTRPAEALPPSGGGGGGGGGASPNGPALAGVTVPPSLRTAKALRNGIPVTLVIGVDDSTVKLELLGKSSLIAAKQRALGSTTKRGVKKGTLKLKVKLRRKAARRIRKLRRVALTLRVSVTPPGGRSEVATRKLKLKRR